ncbi:MAG: hypothetical protein LBS43_03320 [Prevotellaceae bacterium]|jgi:c-di-AMP phosphodiesterase-like protein|nr:hypothetical protein [Prevotellaceae bacterium]
MKMFALFYGPIFGGILAVIMGIAIIAWGQTGYGSICIAAGIVIFILKLSELNKYKQEQDTRKEQTVKVEQENVSLEEQLLINLKVADVLKNGKFSIFLNNKNVGNIIYGEIKQFPTDKKINTIALGKLNGASPDNRMKQYSFDASQENGSINLEITHKSLIIQIVKTA